MQPMSEPITKRTLRERLGLKSDAELAAYYQITRAAVAQWGEEDPVPELRLFQAMKRDPMAFKEILHASGALPPVEPAADASEPLARAG